MGVLTEYYSFLKAGWKEYVDVEKHINNNFDLADNLFHAQSEELKKKEPIINKKSGFNLDITDRKDLNDSNKVVSAKALKEVNEEATKIATTTNSGRVKIGKNLTIKSDGTLEGEDPYSLPKATTSLIGGVKIGKNLTIKSDGTLEAKDQEVDLGTTLGTALEGSKLAETLGIPYGGILNNSSSKVAGTAYYDTTTKKTYKCTLTTSLNYAESTKFEAISNNDLLLKFQNLKSYLIESGNNSNGYYRKYSDGYMEQWGSFVFSASTNSTRKVILPKPYGNINFIPIVSNQYAREVNNGGWGILGIPEISNDGFKVKKAFGDYTIVYWKTTGYIN